MLFGLNAIFFYIDVSKIFGLDLVVERFKIRSILESNRSVIRININR